MPPPPTKNPIFLARKSAILASLSQPSSIYTDASPKGAVDAEIRALVDALNAHPGVVTTSSCAGRVAVFLEGRRGQQRPRRRGSGAHDDGGDSAAGGGGTAGGGASVGGKGAGGRWLYVSHVPVDVAVSALPASASASTAPPATPAPLHALFGLIPRAAAAATATRRHAGGARYAHFKFEAMILHILTHSPATASAVLRAAQAAGFRESGIAGLGACPVVAVRSAGLGLDCVVGVVGGGSRGADEGDDQDGLEGDLDEDEEVEEEQEMVHALVEEAYLETLVLLANERFGENVRRIARFADGVERALAGLEAAGHEGGEAAEEMGGSEVKVPRAKRDGWEDKRARTERKRREGLGLALEAAMEREAAEAKPELEEGMIGWPRPWDGVWLEGGD